MISANGLWGADVTENHWLSKLNKTLKHVHVRFDFNHNYDLKR